MVWQELLNFLVDVEGGVKLTELEEISLAGWFSF